MSNWFVALPVSGDPWFAARVPAAPMGFRRFHPDDLHLTIAFLGPVGEEAARDAFAALQWPLGPVTVTLGLVVPMGDPRRYSALSALLVDGRAEVEDAMASSRGLVWQAARARPDGRPAKAHLTLARPKRSASLADRQAGLAWAEKVDLAGVSARLDRVGLYTWAEDRAQRLFRVVDVRGGARE